MLAILVIVSASTDSDASWRILRVSFSDWLDSSENDSEIAIIIFVGIFLFLLLIVQLYMKYGMWMLGGKYEEERRATKILTE